MSESIPASRRSVLRLAGAQALALAVAACGGGGAGAPGEGGDRPPGGGAGDPGGNPGPGGEPGPGAGDTRPWATAYYAGYYWDQGDMQAPQHVDMTTMSHFVFARVAPGGGSLGGAAPGIVFGADTAGDPENPFSPGWVGVGDPRNRSVMDYMLDKARAAGTKTLLMVGGEGDGWGFAACTDPAVRAAFVKNLLDFADAHGFDGLDIDWEDELDEPTHQVQLIALLKDLRVASKGYARWAAQPLLLTFPGYPINTNYESVDPWKAEVASLVDQYNLMSYAMSHDAFNWKTSHFCPIGGSNPNRPMDLTTSIQAYVDAGVPRSKMGIGIGFYATNWAPPVSGPDQWPEGVRVQSNDTEWMYANLVNKGYLSNGIEQWDETAGMHWRSYAGEGYRPPGASVSGYLSYEDEASIAAKGAWVKSTGVGGAIVWVINYGTTDGVDNPLMDAVKQAFRT